MKRILYKGEDERLRREAFEAYARSCACAESGETYYPAGRKYAALAQELLRGLERPRAEDEELMRRIELLFN